MERVSSKCHPQQSSYHKSHISQKVLWGLDLYRDLGIWEIGDGGDGTRHSRVATTKVSRYHGISLNLPDVFFWTTCHDLESFSCPRRVLTFPHDACLHQGLWLVTSPDVASQWWWIVKSIQLGLLTSNINIHCVYVTWRRPEKNVTSSLSGQILRWIHLAEVELDFGVAFWLWSSNVVEPA